MSAQKALDAKAPRAGDLAPDFTLTDSGGTETVSLSDFRGEKPVALVFGSFT
jgi:peroxiredoxin